MHKLGNLMLLVVFLCILHLGGQAFAQNESTGAEALRESIEIGGRWYGGPVYATAVANDHVYFGAGGSVRVMKVKKSGRNAQPEWIEQARLETPGVVRDLEANGDLLFIADDGGALRIVDISKPKQPEELAYTELPGFVRGVSVSGEHAYLATGWNGMIAVDISDPKNPLVVHDLKKIGYVLDVHVDGSLAAVADSKEGIRLVDVSNPLAPRVLGTAAVPGRAHGVHIEGDLVYAVSLENPEETQVGGLAVVDVSDRMNPELLSFMPLNYGAERIWVEEGKAFLAGVVTDAGLIIVDVSDPALPSKLGSYTDPTCSESIAVGGGFAYLSHGDQGLEIIDYSNPLEPYVARHVAAAGHVRGMHVNGSLAYVANGYTGLRILDLSAGKEPSEVSNLGTYRALDVRVDGDFAFVADDWAGLVVVDVSDPKSPHSVAKYDTPGYAESIALEEGRAFIADGDGGIRVFDISDPLSPLESAAVDTDGYAYDVDVANRVVFLADGKNGLRIFLAAKSVPVEVGFYKPEDQKFEARSVRISGHLAFVAAGYAGLSILDISNIREPREVARLDIPLGARSIGISNDRLYVGDTGGVTELDVSNPTKPSIISRRSLPANADRIFISDSKVYVAAREAGLIILE